MTIPPLYQAIRVHYLPPTNTKPSRYKATCGAGSITRTYDFDGDDTARIAVAKALAEKFDWHGCWIGGGLPDGSHCFVRVPGTYSDKVLIYHFRVEKRPRA